MNLAKEWTVFKMDLGKHNSELASRLKFLDEVADRQLAKEMIELYEERCTRCQEDRLGCTVRPACENRNFLNLLIELGVEPQDLPSFCYTQYLDQIRRYILEHKGRGMQDRRLPIKDLLSTLRVSSIRHFTSRFGKIWSNLSVVRENDTMLVAGEDLFFHFNFANGIVILNPTHQPIQEYEVFKLYVALLSDHYQLEAVANDLTTNWWNVVITLPGSDVVQSNKPSIKELSSRFEELFIESSEDAVYVEAEVILENDTSIEVRDLVELFKFASEMKEK
jgi:hypothetical protein